jgi:APA family basic amino acid/polyamine antiporter
MGSAVSPPLGMGSSGAVSGSVLTQPHHLLLNAGKQLLRGTIQGAILKEAKTTYDRRLSLFDGTMVVIGGIVGAGIFLNPAIVAERTRTSGLTLLAWAIGGAIALIGAVCFGELGSRRPLAGGSYVYLKDIFGPLPAFLYGWTYLLVVNTGGIAAVGVTFAGYACSLVGLTASAIKPMTIAAIVFLSGVNYLGIRPGSITLNIFTLLRLLALAALISVGLMAVGTGEVTTNAITRGSSGNIFAVLGVALIPVLFSYGGWQHANHIAGEIKSPGRNLPRALLLGVTTVVTFYLLTNVAYLNALGVEGLGSSTAPAADTMRAVLGSLGARLMAAGIACSTFGFLSLAILAGPRIYQAMADDGVFFSWAADLHPRYRTPAGAIVFQAAWAILLTLSGTYGQLLDYVVFGDWIFFGLTVATLFFYRRRETVPPDDAATAWGYPVLPAVFVAAAAYTVVSSILSNPLNALLGACLIAAGIPAFFYWKRR